MFPLSIKGKINTRYTKAGLVIQRLEPALVAAGATDVKSGSNFIMFEGGMSKFEIGRRWWPLGLLGRCELHFHSGVLGYICSTRKAAVLAALMALLAFLFVTLAPQTNIPLEVRILILIATWLGLFGMNYLISSFRFSRFLKRALSDG
ncbi:MAG: hypothetical protein K9G60_16875 [Pseudolabrys sp.]|nr:hypothetical protein [Pseudolabrys sp.]